MISVILLRGKNPSNIGFIARAMANFDIESLILIAPECNHLEDAGLRTSKHAKNILEKAQVKPYSYLQAIRADFNIVVGTTSVMGTDYNIPRTPLSPEKFARKIDNQKIALVFGNEGTGLTNDEIGQCDFLISIPTSREYPALNISHAAAIIFYEIYKQTGKNKITSHIKPASVREKEIIMKKMNNIINQISFSTPEKKHTQQVTWKKIFEQSMMSKREAFVLMGLLRKIERLTSSDV